MLGRLSLAYWRLVKALAYALAAVAGVSLVAMVALTCVDVVGTTSTKVLRVYETLCRAALTAACAGAVLSVPIALVRRRAAARREILRIVHLAIVSVTAAAAFVLVAAVTFGLLDAVFAEAGAAPAAIIESAGRLVLVLAAAWAAFGGWLAARPGRPAGVWQLWKGLLMSAAGLLCTVAVVFSLGLVNRLCRSFMIGVYDVVVIAGTLTIACALPYTTAVKGHVAIEYFFLKLPRAGKLVVDTLARLMTMTFFVFLTVQLFRYGRSLKDTGEVTLTLKIPVYWIPYVIGASSAVVTLVIFNHLLHPGKETIKP